MQLAQFSIIILVRYPKSPNVSGPVGCVDLKSVSIYSGCPGWTNLCWKVKVWNPFYCQQDKLRETHHLVFKTALRRRCIFTIYAFREFVYKNTKRKEAKRNKNYEQNVNNNKKTHQCDILKAGATITHLKRLIWIIWILHIALNALGDTSPLFQQSLNDCKSLCSTHTIINEMIIFYV